MVMGKGIFLPVVFTVVFRFPTDNISPHLGTFCRPLLTNMDLIRIFNICYFSVDDVLILLWFEFAVSRYE